MGWLNRIFAAVGGLLALFFATPASATWLQAESKNFVVYSDGKEAELRSYVLLLEDFDSLLRTLTGAGAAPASNKLHLYLVGSTGDLRKVRNVGAEVLGFYSATPEGVAAFAIRREDGSGFGADDVILHEYAHHFMLQNFPANYPGWYIEGFAEYLATASFTPDNIEIGRFNDHRASWLATTRLSLDRVLTADSIPLENQTDVAKFYAQSWLMVHYLMRDPQRRQALQAYLRAFGSGADPKTTFRTIFKTDATGFHRSLADYGRKMSFTRVTRSSNATPVAVELRTLPPAADDLLLFDAGLRLGLADWRKYPLLPRVRRAAKKHEGDPFAVKTLVRAELLYGDRTAADAMLDRLLKAQPGDRDGLYLRGLSHILAGRADNANRAVHFVKARPWLARAHKADENFHPALVRYAESFSADAQYASENVGNVLLLASQLAPQVSLIRLNAAQQLAVRGEMKEAEAVLAPVVNEPHSKRERTAARALLAQIKSGTRPTPLFHVEALER